MVQNQRQIDIFTAKIPAEIAEALDKTPDLGGVVRFNERINVRPASHHKLCQDQDSIADDVSVLPPRFHSRVKFALPAAASMPMRQDLCTAARHEEQPARRRTKPIRQCLINTRFCVSNSCDSSGNAVRHRLTAANSSVCFRWKVAGHVYQTCWPETLRPRYQLPVGHAKLQWHDARASDSSTERLREQTHDDDDSRDGDKHDQTKRVLKKRHVTIAADDFPPPA